MGASNSGKEEKEGAANDLNDGGAVMVCAVQVACTFKTRDAHNVIAHLFSFYVHHPFTPKMRPLTEEESKTVFEKLANYIVRIPTICTWIIQ